MNAQRIEEIRVRLASYDEPHRKICAMVESGQYDHEIETQLREQRREADITIDLFAIDDIRDLLEDNTAQAIRIATLEAENETLTQDVYAAQRARARTEADLQRALAELDAYRSEACQ